ncbi:hypothetical protein YC2023_038568 [Brassica napus]
MNGQTQFVMRVVKPWKRFFMSCSLSYSSGSPASGTNRASSLWFFAVIYLSEPSYLVASTKKKQRTDYGNIKSFPWILWNLWKGRNALVFEKSRISSASCISKSLEEGDIWYMVNYNENNQAAALETSRLHTTLGKSLPLFYQMQCWHGLG